MTDHRTVFGTVERDYWAEAAGLKPDERALIERYLDRDASTVEAGTGGGRILGEMSRLGFASLAGFDFVSELVAEARRSDPTGAIPFEVQDARRLDYPDRSFDQVLYLQQLLSALEDEGDRRRVISEAFRILKPGGIALLSVLPFEVRTRSIRHRPYLLYLRLLRRLRRTRRPDQLLPRLRMRGRLNPGALRDAGPHVYWYRAEEIERELRGAGFEVEAIGSTPQVVSGEMRGSAIGLRDEHLEGTLYVVCRRPAERR
ncbi:MAG TPA: class I SAM-dependent methyltransferase [Solirubrobacterales bacterium]|nr:class I SAM-dependent methyltransferase [Solirubrobacterales bacterium]